MSDSLVRISNSSGDIKSGYFFNNLNKCKEFICSGLIPTEQILEIYNKSCPEEMIELFEDVNHKLEEIINTKKFNPKDLFDRYAMYCFAKGYRHIHLTNFKKFNNACKRYVKGEYLSDNYSYEIEILTKYSSIPYPHGVE